MVTRRENVLPGWLGAMYPFDGYFLETSAGKIHFVDEGNGPPVLLLHGNPTWSFFYRKLILRLIPTSRCLAPDHLGCGLSGKPRHWSYRLRDHIDNVERLLDTLGVERFALAVHDWGGTIGMGVATRRPEAVTRIQILNTAAFRSRLIPRRIAVCRTPLLGPIAVRGANAFARAATHMAVERALPRDVRRGYLYPYDSWANRIAIHRFVQDIPLEPSHLSYSELERIESSLEKLRDKPVQIHWGMQDFCFTPAYLEAWRRHLPGAKVHELNSAGHYVLEDAASETLDEMADFLAGGGG